MVTSRCVGSVFWEGVYFRVLFSFWVVGFGRGVLGGGVFMLRFGGWVWEEEFCVFFFLFFFFFFFEGGVVFFFFFFFFSVDRRIFSSLS